MKIHDVLKLTTDFRIIEMCKECEQWKKSGILPDGEFKSFCEDIKNIINDKKQIEDYVFLEALDRFKDISKILFLKYPYEFIN